MTKEEMQYKIDNEITVDCYDEYEVNLGWFTFFGDELSFPFEAEILTKIRRGTKQLVKVDVLRLVDNVDYDRLGIHFEVSPKNSDIVSEIHISKFKSIDTDEDEIIKEAFEIWQYWQANH